MSGSNQTPPIGFKTPVREAVGIFASQRDLQAAIDDLLTSGFARCELRLRGTETEATAGRAPELEARALRILSSHAANHVHSHSLAA